MRTLKLGLALGAGGTKGAAHVGVMQVLDEAGIKPEIIAGTSIGSLYGGCYAVGRTADEMADGIRACPPTDVLRFFQRRLKIRDKNRLARRFYEALAGFHIEDLPVKYAATASDIGARRHVHITSGPMIDAIEASIAIPLIARPVHHAELTAPLETRLHRNGTENRQQHKKLDWATDDRLREMESWGAWHSDGHLPATDPHIIIDNTALTPDEAAHRIQQAFALSAAAD
jgi:predicted acylesterase/phospholipase RssA